ncbi:hypothetical protein K2173_006523 [Erythroxylum novogranatense]|uniref:GBF-interacting protein 1 N-terminal domain-containing protein n=1 Tax=Erythroxylum novogranatense TaxID=1862640 RepID=A0AAV8T555_9ROSI|nr:hypothetical protein K2173_006523 [Erythroxylum novogranatense]
MSGKGGGGDSSTTNAAGKGNNGISTIPAGSRKIVQSLKEIVNCPELEIYAMLKDCNMDPNEAVNRLLAQDPFHEVKSKREKKKENKDPVDLRFRGANSMTHRGGRGGADRNVRDYSASHGKSTYKRENGTHAYAGLPSSACGTGGDNFNWQTPLPSDPVATESKSSTSAGDGFSSSSQPSSGFQSAWLGASGQASMADIVKMGRPHNKVSAVPPHHNIYHQSDSAHPLAASHYDLHLSNNCASNVPEIKGMPEVVASQQHMHSEDEWPSIEDQPPASVSSVLEVPADSELYLDPANMPLSRVTKHTRPQVDDVLPIEDDHVENLRGNHAVSASVSSKDDRKDDSGGSALLEDNLYGDLSSYEPHNHTFEHNQGEADDDPSSVAVNFRHLTLENDDQEAATIEDNPSVIIPDHLQVNAQDCSHLSFGTFGSAIGTGFSGSFAAMPTKSTLEETSELVDAPSTGHPETRNPEYYGDEHLRSTADESLVHRTGVNAGNFDSPSVPQPEVLKEESIEVSQGNQYAFHSTTPDYPYENTQQLNDVFNNPQTSSQMQNIASLSSVLQAYNNSLSSTLLGSTVQAGREHELPYSPFPVTQSMPIKYSNAPSSISGPSISMPEALRAGSISTPQLTSQTLPGASVAAGSTLPQHLAVHPYSQHTLPLGHFANMISYPFLPQSYPYMPSAYQQAYAGNTAYHQSLASVLPQYKNNLSVGGLPQSAGVASGYGFGNSTNIAAGNFPLNAPTAPGGTTISYDDVLSSQYKDSSHLVSLQQNENSAPWVHGPSSRTMSGIPASNYYSLQGQNQQGAGFRQGQQPSQQFGALGYPNYYHSQTGISLEHQQQNSRDGSLAMGGSQSQVQPSKQTQQLWQNGY